LSQALPTSQEEAWKINCYFPKSNDKILRLEHQAAKWSLQIKDRTHFWIAEIDLIKQVPNSFENTTSFSVNAPSIKLKNSATKIRISVVSSPNQKEKENQNHEGGGLKIRILLTNKYTKKDISWFLS